MKKYSLFIAIGFIITFTSCDPNNGAWGQMPSEEPSIFTKGVPKINGVGFIRTPPITLDLSSGPVWEWNANANAYYIMTGKWIYNSLGGHRSDGMQVYVSLIGRDGVLRHNQPVFAAYDNQVLDEQAWLSALFVPRTTNLAIRFPMQVSVNYRVDQYGNDRFTVR